MTSEESFTSDIAVHIFNTFKVSIRQANEYDVDIKDLISAKGGDPASFTSLDLKELVTKQLKDKYEWKSSAVREPWEARQKEKSDSYNKFIGGRRSRVFK